MVGKLRTYFTVEPIIACWILPSLFLYIANENLGLKKVNII